MSVALDWRSKKNITNTQVRQSTITLAIYSQENFNSFLLLIALLFVSIVM